MSNAESINEIPITMAEFKEKIEDIKKRDKELKPRALKTLEYLDKFTKIKAKEALKLKEELVKLQIPRLKERHIIKIIDIMPKDIETLKLIFVGENLTIKQDDLEKILNVIK
jgi:DNA-directed RNA polymerase subunit F